MAWTYEFFSPWGYIALTSRRTRSCQCHEVCFAPTLTYSVPATTHLRSLNAAFAETRSQSLSAVEAIKADENVSLRWKWNEFNFQLVSTVPSFSNAVRYISDDLMNTILYTRNTTFMHCPMPHSSNPIAPNLKTGRYQRAFRPSRHRPPPHEPSPHRIVRLPFWSSAD